MSFAWDMGCNHASVTMGGCCDCEGYTTPYNKSPFPGALLTMMSTTTNRDTLQYESMGGRHDRTWTHIHPDEQLAQWAIDTLSCMVQWLSSEIKLRIHTALGMTIYPNVTSRNTTVTLLTNFRLVLGHTVTSICIPGFPELMFHAWTWMHSQWHYPPTCHTASGSSGSRKISTPDPISCL